MEQAVVAVFGGAAQRIGVALKLAAGGVGEGGLLAVGGGDGGDLAHRVVTIASGAVQRVGDGGDAAKAVVLETPLAFSGALGDELAVFVPFEQEGYAHGRDDLGRPAMTVITIAGGVAIGVGAGGKQAIAVVAAFPTVAEGVGDAGGLHVSRAQRVVVGQFGGGAEGVGVADQPALVVVYVALTMALGIADFQRQAVVVVGDGGGGAIGVDPAGDQTQVIVMVFGGVAAAVGAAGDAPFGVVFKMVVVDAPFAPIALAAAVNIVAVPFKKERKTVGRGALGDNVVAVGVALAMAGGIDGATQVAIPVVLVADQRFADTRAFTTLGQTGFLVEHAGAPGRRFAQLMTVAIH